MTARCVRICRVPNPGMKTPVLSQPLPSDPPDDGVDVRHGYGVAPRQRRQRQAIIAVQAPDLQDALLGQLRARTSFSATCLSMLNRVRGVAFARTFVKMARPTARRISAFVACHSFDKPSKFQRLRRAMRTDLAITHGELAVAPLTATSGFPKPAPFSTTRDLAPKYFGFCLELRKGKYARRFWFEQFPACAALSGAPMVDVQVDWCCQMATAASFGHRTPLAQCQRYGQPGLAGDRRLQCTTAWLTTSLHARSAVVPQRSNARPSLARTGNTPRRPP